MSAYVFGYFLFERELSFEEQEALAITLTRQTHEAGFGLLVGLGPDTRLFMEVTGEPQPTLSGDKLAFQLNESILIGAAGSSILDPSNRVEAEVDEMLETFQTLIASYLDVMGVRAVRAYATDWAQRPDHPPRSINVKDIARTIRQAMSDSTGVLFGLYSVAFEVSAAP